MSKIVITYFNGSPRLKAGDTQKVIDLLLLEVSKVLSKHEIQHLTASESMKEVSSCIGCSKCFSTGECILNDGMVNIKGNLLKSDLVILASPVYLNSISSSTKIFMDRLAYWSHLMPLIGKKCVIIASTQNSGLDETLKYLYEIASYWGLEVIGLIGYRKMDKIDKLNAQIKFCGERVLRSMSIDKNFNISDFRSNVFISFKNLYQSIYNTNAENFEANYWKQNGYLEMADLYEIVKKLDSRSINMIETE